MTEDFDERKWTALRLSWLSLPMDASDTEIIERAQHIYSWPVTIDQLRSRLPPDD